MRQKPDLAEFYAKYPHLKPVPWPAWEKAAKCFLDFFELGDHEYIRGEWGGGPWLRGWFTILEPRYRNGLSRLMPWRIRFGWASILRMWIWSRCTGCGQEFTIHELVYDRSNLTFHMSGSIIHHACERLWSNVDSAHREAGQQ